MHRKWNPLARSLRTTAPVTTHGCAPGARGLDLAGCAPPLGAPRPSRAARRRAHDRALVAVKI